MRPEGRFSASLARRLGSASNNPSPRRRWSGPNPSAAAVLGLIPGVGAMYNGQFFKGLIHVVIFAVLVSITSSINGIFGIFIGAWVLYQSFEAYHTAKALRDGQPPPDPLGLNEVGNWLNLGAHPRTPGQAPPASTGQAQAPGSYQTPYAAGAIPAAVPDALSAASAGLSRSGHAAHSAAITGAVRSLSAQSS